MYYKSMYTLIPKVKYRIWNLDVTNYFLSEFTHSVLENIFILIYITCKNDNEFTKFLKRPYELFYNFNFECNAIFKSLYSRCASVGIIDLYTMAPDLHDITTSRLISRNTFKI